MIDSCEVLIIGAGPAGSTCAERLVRAGVDVLLVDGQRFPRDKPCAGWITPAVIETLAIDREDYCRGRLLQEIRGFRTGVMFGREIVTGYATVVSYGIRRGEFDQYLLQRSAVRRRLGEPIKQLERKDGYWLVDGCIRARLLVGAGGHSCPVARHLGARIGHERVIVAQSAEFELTSRQENLWREFGEMPGLYFCGDLKGYGWIFRKGRFLNVGFGRLEQEDFGRHRELFQRFIETRGLAEEVGGRYRGHAYLANQLRGGRRRVGDYALLIGDAAGISSPRSGEGILPAVESALLASRTILEAAGDYRSDKLRPYLTRLEERVGAAGAGLASRVLDTGPCRAIGSRLLSSRWFTRQIVLDRLFLHQDRATLTID